MNEKDPVYKPPVLKKDRIPKPAFVDKPATTGQRHEDTTKLR